MCNVKIEVQSFLIRGMPRMRKWRVINQHKKGEPKFPED